MAGLSKLQRKNFIRIYTGQLLRNVNFEIKMDSDDETNSLENEIEEKGESMLYTDEERGIATTDDIYRYVKMNF